MQYFVPSEMQVVGVQSFHLVVMMSVNWIAILFALFALIFSLFDVAGANTTSDRIINEKAKQVQTVSHQQGHYDDFGLRHDNLDFGIRSML